MLRRKQKTMNSICEKPHTVFRDAKRTLKSTTSGNLFFSLLLWFSKVRCMLFQEVWFRFVVSEILVFLKLFLFLMQNDALSCEVVFFLSVG